MAHTRSKLFYKIGEVCKISGVQPHVLRYWETEFKALSPTKNKAGHRIYRKKDVWLVQTIKRLLHEEGYSISGANMRIVSEGKKSLPLFRNTESNHPSLFSEIKRELGEILKLLSQD